MKKKEHGAIYVIPIPKINKYSYGKYLHLPDITGHTYDSHIFKVFDFLTKKPVIDIKQVDTSKLLYSPFLLAGKPRAIDLGWKNIGIVAASDDNFFPDFKQNFGVKWSIVKYYDNDNTSDDRIEDFSRIAHLEHSTLRSLIEIPFRILMELLRKEGKDIEKELDFEGEDKVMLNTYEKMKDIPIYSKIPEEYRGRVLPEGVKLKLNE